MDVIAATPRPLTPAAVIAILAAAVMLAPSAVATVPADEGEVVVSDPWTGAARTLHVGVETSCSAGAPTLRVTTYDHAWEEHLRSTFQLSSEIPFVTTRAEVYWHNHDTAEHGEGVAHGINGAISGNNTWEISPGLTDVEVYLTLSPGVPVEIGPARPHMNSGAFGVSVLDC